MKSYSKLLMTLLLVYEEELDEEEGSDEGTSLSFSGVCMFR